MSDNTDDSFDIDGQDSNEVNLPIELPPQQSANDTSNWDGRVSIAPDGREHIKDLDQDNTTDK